MSTYFSPRSPEITEETNPDQLLWSGWLFLKNIAGVPKQYLGNEGFDWQDLEMKVHEYNYRRFDFWQNFIREHDMHLYEGEDWPGSKLYVRTFGPNHEISYGLRISAKWPDFINKEFNIAYGNVSRVLDLLGLPESGCMNPHAVLKAIENRNPDILYTQEPTDTGGEGTGNVRVIDYGMDQNRLKGYLIRIEELCDFCIQQEVDICWG